MSTAALAVIDAAMKEDDKLTASQLQGIYMSLDENDPVIDEAILTHEWSWTKLGNAHEAR